MVDISAKSPSKRDLVFFRQQNRNKIFEKLITFFAKRAESDGLTKRDVAAFLGKDPAQITRLLSGPANWELDTISDLILALEADIEYEIADLRDLGIRNSVPPLVAFLEKASPPPTSPIDPPQTTPSSGGEVRYRKVDRETVERMKPLPVPAS
jgi:transcriptional regulator with XRE-family HTH domain